MSRLSTLQRILPLLGIVLILGGGLAGAKAAWMASKAIVAQELLERAWTRQSAMHDDSTAAGRPWPWADITAVAKLSVPGQQTSLIVLQDASGEAMAFGPGLVAGQPLRADHSTIVLGGHRDSHLAFLETLAIGSELRLETADGRRHRYRFEHSDIVDSRVDKTGVHPGRPGLVMITCYPFRASQTGGPLRYVASARYLGSDHS